MRPGSEGSFSARRALLRRLFWSLAAGGLPSWCVAGAGQALVARSLSELGPLGAPDALGLRLPPGCVSRVVAVAGERPVPGASERWHAMPDGAAVFPREGGGWIYTSNSEIDHLGGASSLVFDARGEGVDCVRVLSNTRRNCAGGATPWNSWLSCEEVDAGQVWECDPLGREPAVVRPALGRFSHEAVAVQAATRSTFMTEDAPDGRFYRFVSSAADWPVGGRAALAQGRLQALQRMGDIEATRHAPQPVRWVDVAHPDRPQHTQRRAETQAFRGGEGLWLHDGLVYFSTKHDNRIWLHDTQAQTLELVYDFASAPPSDRILSGVDNLVGTRSGEILVAEDGGDMQLCLILRDRRVRPLLQLVGQDDSELTGPAFSPDGRRLYFSSQRGARHGRGLGITYEVQLPFAV